MDTKLKHPLNTECVLNIENLRLKILVDKTDAVMTDGLPAHPDTDAYAGNTPHQHAYTEIFCCPNGTLHINAVNQIIRLNKGDIAIIPDGITHNMLPVINADDWAALRFQIIPIKRKDCKDLFSLLHGICHHDSIRLFRNPAGLADKIQYIFKNLISSDDPYPLVISLFQILYRLSLTEPVQTEKMNEESMPQHGDSDMQRYEVIDYFINKCYTYALTPSFLAEQLHISERQTARIVRTRYGMSFHRALLAKRVMVAEQMLTKSNIKIQEIARAVGFRSPDIFYKEFKRKYGMTPREYRRLVLGKTDMTD